VLIPYCYQPYIKPAVYEQYIRQEDNLNTLFNQHIINTPHHYHCLVHDNRSKVFLLNIEDAEEGETLKKALGVGDEIKSL